jgi:hypothetical protein
MSTFTQPKVRKNRMNHKAEASEGLVRLPARSDDAPPALGAGLLTPPRFGLYWFEKTPDRLCRNPVVRDGEAPAELLISASAGVSPSRKQPELRGSLQSPPDPFVRRAKA